MNELKSTGYNVSSFGLIEGDNGKIKTCDVIVLPVPTTKDKMNVFCPLSKKTIPLEDVAKKAKNQLILSCGYSFENKNNIDFLKLDSYSNLNAIPTAEGAIAFAIDNTDFTLWKAKVLIIGFGRIAKVLVNRLSAFGCDLTVSARKSRDFSYLETKNLKWIKTNNVSEIAKDFDIIFNTVDVNVFDDISTFDGTMLIDLSSKGCLDYSKEGVKDKKIYKLPGLPGKVAPITAGKILARTVMELIENPQRR